MSDAPHHDEPVTPPHHDEPVTPPHHDEPAHPPHVPTVDEILATMMKQGVTDLDTLAHKIHEQAVLAAGADEPATESTFIWDGDAYVYHHVSVPTTTTCW